VKVLNIKETGKSRGGLISGGTYNRKYFLFTGRWAYNRGGLVSGVLISGGLRYLCIYQYH